MLQGVVPLSPAAIVRWGFFYCPLRIHSLNILFPGWECFVPKVTGPGTCLLIYWNLKKHSPMCPFFWEPLYTKVLFRGYVCQKGCPNPAPTVPLKKFGNSFCVYANDRLRRRKRLFGRTRTLARRHLAPCTKALRTTSAYFAYHVCLLQNNRLLTSNHQGYSRVHLGYSYRQLYPGLNA